MSGRSAPSLLFVALALTSLGAVAGGGAPDGGSRYRSGLEAFRAGDFARAQTEFEAALAALPPGDALVFQSEYNLARTVEEQGRACDAAEAFERFLAHAPAATAVERSRAEKARAAEARTRAACDAAPVEETPPPPAVAAPPAGQAHATAPADHGEDPRGVILSATVASGVLFRDGPHRTHLTPELTGGYRFGDLHGELALAAVAEAPHALVVRPGLRWTFGAGVYGRAAVQALFGEITAAGLLLGPGLDVELAEHWWLTGELDASFWPSATSVIPIDLRVGARHAF